MTTHILDDSRDYETNADRRMLCGIVGKLPEGDVFHYPSEGCAVHVADCQGCNPGGPLPWGTPLSQLAGRPDGTRAGEAAYERFKDIAASWGYD